MKSRGSIFLHDFRKWPPGVITYRQKQRLRGEGRFRLTSNKKLPVELVRGRPAALRKGILQTLQRLCKDFDSRATNRCQWNSSGVALPPCGKVFFKRSRGCAEISTHEQQTVDNGTRPGSEGGVFAIREGWKSKKLFFSACGLAKRYSSNAPEVGQRFRLTSNKPLPVELVRGRPAALRKGILFFFFFLFSFFFRRVLLFHLFNPWVPSHVSSKVKMWKYENSMKKKEG